MHTGTPDVNPMPWKKEKKLEIGSRESVGAGKERKKRQCLPAFPFFTLIELLLVITIIAILSAIMLPALQKARSMANRSACISQLKQTGFGILQYTMDFRGGIPPAQTLLNPTVSTYRTNWWGGMMWEYKYIGNARALRCSVFFPLDPSTANWNYAWNKTYAIRSVKTLLDGTTVTETRESCGNAEREKRPSCFILSCDSKTNRSILDNSLSYTLQTYGSVNMIGLRHEQTANLLFLDGHARSYGKSEVAAIGDVDVFKAGLVW